MKHIPVGTIVCVERTDPGEEEGEKQLIPAIVTGQWPTGSLQLYAFHFEGSPVLFRDVPLDRVYMVGMREPVEPRKVFA